MTIFTVEPWNAEGLGLFIDFGDVDITGPVGLTNIVPQDQIELYATDTMSNSCGQGCNLNGIDAPIANPDEEWELVFRLGRQGSQGIQTFSFSINDFGLDESAWGLVGVRAQQLCGPGDDPLPDGMCGGSDKSFGSGVIDPGPDPDPNPSVPVPGTLLLLGLGLLARIAPQVQVYFIAVPGQLLLGLALLALLMPSLLAAFVEAARDGFLNLPGLG